MKIKRLEPYYILCCIIVLSGCAASKPDVPGTKAWHEKRTTEIQQALDQGEITQAQYINLKNEADKIRAMKQSERILHGHMGYVFY